MRSFDVGDEVGVAIFPSRKRTGILGVGCGPRDVSGLQQVAVLHLLWWCSGFALPAILDFHPMHTVDRRARIAHPRCLVRVAMISARDIVSAQDVSRFNRVQEFPKVRNTAATVRIRCSSDYQLSFVTYVSRSPGLAPSMSVMSMVLFGANSFFGFGLVPSISLIFRGSRLKGTSIGSVGTNLGIG